MRSRDQQGAILLFIMDLAGGSSFGFALMAAYEERALNSPAKLKSDEFVI